MRRAIITLTLALSGCSVVTGGLELPHCSQNSECSVLNEINGIANDACTLFQCNYESSTCELQTRDDDRDGLVAQACAAAGDTADCNDEVPSGTEVCNGIDDDCDGIIDEHFVVEGVGRNPLPAALPSTLVSGATFSASGTVGYGTSDGSFAVAYAERGRGSYGIVSGASASGPVTMGFQRADRLDILSDVLVEGCHTSTASGYSTAGCNFGDVDLGLSDDNVFAAVVNQSGCTDGQLRVGYFPRTDATGQIIQRGPLRRSNAFAGVDVMTDGTNPCTGASRSSGVRGAARPSVEAGDTSSGPDQALAAWIADSASRPLCSGTEADVEILGLYVQKDASGVGWVTGSNEGIPQVIGRTTQGGRPGIGAWESTGYLVGFGAPGSGVHLVFVAGMDRLPTFTSGAVDDRTGLEIAPLAITDLGTIPTDGPADDVVIAQGSIVQGGRRFGVAWREGCGTGSETIRFREIFVTNGGASIDESKSFDPIVLTPSASPAAGPPAMAFATRGMIEASENDGGWIVAWSDASNPNPGPADDSHIYARRISEADGALLSPDELLELNPPGDVQRLNPVLYTDASDRVLYGFLALGTENGFRGGALTCVAP